MSDLDPTSTGRRLFAPMKCAMYFALALHGESAAELLDALGIDVEEFDKFERDFSVEIAEMRRLNALGALMTREALARLIRARLAEQLMASSKATELAVLTRAASRLPAWIFGEEEPTHAPRSAGALPASA